MDMSFARRRKAALHTGTPDLATLLAHLGTEQAASRTARVHAYLQSSDVASAANPLIEIFAPDGVHVVTTHSFSDRVPASVTRRQPS